MTTFTEADVLQILSGFQPSHLRYWIRLKTGEESTIKNKQQLAKLVTKLFAEKTAKKKYKTLVDYTSGFRVELTEDKDFRRIGRDRSTLTLEELRETAQDQIVKAFNKYKLESDYVGFVIGKTGTVAKGRLTENVSDCLSRRMRDTYHAQQYTTIIAVAKIFPRDNSQPAAKESEKAALQLESDMQRIFKKSHKTTYCAALRKAIGDNAGPTISHYPKHYCAVVYLAMKPQIVTEIVEDSSDESDEDS